MARVRETNKSAWKKGVKEKGETANCYLGRPRSETHIKLYSKK